MSTDRRERLWSLVVQQAHGGTVAIGHVCGALLVRTSMDGASVIVALGPGLRETMYASDGLASDLALLALTLGEGPSVDAGAGRLVLVADLADASHSARWPAFAPAAVAIGSRATVALPLQVGGIRLGAIELHRRTPGSLSPAQIDDGLMLADTACALLIDSAHDLFPNADGQIPERVRLQHPEVHQATGMVIAQLGVSPADALVRLRAYAYAHNVLLRDVARRVVTRELRFHSDGHNDDRG